MDKYLILPDLVKRGYLYKALEKGDLKGELLIPWRAMNKLISEEQNEFYREKNIRELERVKKLADEGRIKIRYIDDEVGNDLEAIHNVSDKYEAVVATSDEIIYRGLRVINTPAVLISYDTLETPSIEKFFDEHTMSIHLKEGVEPHAKKGYPGEWRFEKIGEKPLTREEIIDLIDEIMDFVEEDEESFIESDSRGVTIIQMRNYRIVIARPPFSDGYELTAVRPVKSLKLEDYNLPRELIKRLTERAEGILISGAPGEGKTTFCQALAEYYISMGKVVKTIESPRDLNLPPNASQYSKSYGDEQTIHDILLLSRPDYTIFDEMRNTEDFKLYIDLRLAGVGMVGVVHATKPIDAVQRFVDRLELGMIPSVIDTVIYIKGGKVAKVYEISMAAKVPHGLSGEELARPVVEVRDFFTKKIEYEFYIFGKRVFVIPVGKEHLYTEEGGYTIEDEIKRDLGDLGEDIEVKVLNNREVVIYVPPWNYRGIKRALRRKSKLIKKKYGLKVSIEPVIGYE